MNQSIKYFEVFRSKFDKKNNIASINTIAIFTDTFKRISDNYTQCSFKNYGYECLMPMAMKKYVAIKAVTAQFINDCCKEITVDKVDQILIQEVNKR